MCLQYIPSEKVSHALQTELYMQVMDEKKKGRQKKTTLKMQVEVHFVQSPFL